MAHLPRRCGRCTPPPLHIAPSRPIFSYIPPESHPPPSLYSSTAHTCRDGDGEGGLHATCCYSVQSREAAVYPLGTQLCRLGGNDRHVGVLQGCYISRSQVEGFHSLLLTPTHSHSLQLTPIHFHSLPLTLTPSHSHSLHLSLPGRRLLSPSACAFGLCIRLTGTSGSWVQRQPLTGSCQALRRPGDHSRPLTPTHSHSLPLTPTHSGVHFVVCGM